jgi:hypothetical protein
VFQKAVRRRTCKLYILGTDIAQAEAFQKQMFLAQTRGSVSPPAGVSSSKLPIIPFFKHFMQQDFH